MILVVMLCSMACYVQAQLTLDELSAKLESETGQDELKGKGLLLHNYYSAKIPKKYFIEKEFKYKKVGILTVMVNQLTGEAAASTGNNYRSTTKKFDMSKKELFAIASKVAPSIESGLKDAGKKMGIEVLTPREYLSNDDLINEYLNISLEKGTMVEAGKIEAANGYRSFPKLAHSAVPGLGGVTYSSYYTIGLLAQKCGLDALILVNLNGFPTVYKNGDRKFLFYNVSFSNMFVNQTPFIEGFKYSKLLGGYPALYGGGGSTLTAGGAPILEFEESGKPIVSGGDFEVSNGVQTITTEFTVPIKLVADYTDDLGKVTLNFSRNYLEQIQAFVEKVNKQNKLIN